MGELVHISCQEKMGYKSVSKTLKSSTLKKIYLAHVTIQDYPTACAALFKREKIRILIVNTRNNQTDPDHVTTLVIISSC